MAAPQVTITVSGEGHLQVASNVTDAVWLLGLLESAKFTVLTRPMQAPPRLLPVNGRRLVP